MLKKEIKYKYTDLIYHSWQGKDNKGNFIILDDKTTKINDDIIKILKLIEKYNYLVEMIDLKETSENIMFELKNIRYLFDSVLTVGMGGLQSYRQVKDSLKDKEILNIKWNREWQGDKSLGFDTDINEYILEGRKILILEDVIASGNTLWTLKNEIEKLGGKVVMIASSLIQESSPIIHQSFSPTYSSIMIRKPKDSSLDPFWYPPIYSLRHLMYGDEEMNSFYKVLNEKYFNNVDEVERMIKRVRKK